MKLKDKVAVVTGGARDIGRAVSLKLANEGAKVVINYFDNPDDAEETLKMINDIGGDAIIVQGDMTKEDDIEKLVNASIDAFGEKIDLLVNVAGGLVARKTIEEMDSNFWDFLMTLNLKTVFMVTKAVVAHMSNNGSIVNFKSYSYGNATISLNDGTEFIRVITRRSVVQIDSPLFFIFVWNVFWVYCLMAGI